MTFHVGWNENNGPFHLGWLNNDDVVITPTQRPYNGGASPGIGSLPYVEPVHTWLTEDDEIIMLCIKEFLKLVDNG